MTDTKSVPQINLWLSIAFVLLLLFLPRSNRRPIGNQWLPPYAALLAVAEASESVDQAGMAGLARAAGVDPDRLNRALLAATAWASEVTEYWE